MNIQEYSALIAQVAKIETMKAQLKEMKSKMDSISVEQAEAYHIGADIEKVNEINDRWLSAYKERDKMERKIKKEYKSFRAKIETEEYSYLASDFRYSSDSGDASFYWYVRYKLLREATQIEFTTGK